MSHKITNNMIAWKGETPWHGLGYKVEEGATGEEMLVKAGLDWEVQTRRIKMEDKTGKKMLANFIKGYRSIVRADTDEIYQIATEGYHPVQNREIVDFFGEYCEAGHASMETVGGLKGGRIVWALAK